ncbi:thioredoxin family protein [Roseobacter sinensis]|uniref:Thioredoxin family protein n=1 Tax=Roseobacter sinensis TaxID=2931391 RepID=A0ABT3BHG5_9RHOB|nr:thioredoxin family protein [Roseobacter sp. WL0113]MCV3273018.1 thioredoxin family protein [Roseobacter sp. WL0113]
MSKPRKSHRRKSTPKGGEARSSRRDVLRWIRNGAVGAVVVAGGGYVAVGSFRAYAAEHDLSRLGQGKPTVVQVHDPQCPTCTALQKQTRRALTEFGECDLLYLIADITTPDGQAFAVRYGVGNVTLLLFDAEGGLQQAVQGMHSKDQLMPILRSHHASHAMISG